MEHMRTVVGLFGRAVLWEAHFPQHGRMGEDTGFPAWICFFLPFQSTSARSNEPFSMFALIFFCVLLWQTWYLKVVTGGAGDYWLASPNLFLGLLLSPRTVCNKVKRKVKQGRGLCGTQSRPFLYRGVARWIQTENMLEPEIHFGFTCQGRDSFLLPTALQSFLLSNAGMQRQRRSHAFVSKHWVHLNIRRGAPGCRRSAKQWWFVVSNWFFLIGKIMLASSERANT